MKPLYRRRFMDWPAEERKRSHTMNRHLYYAYYPDGDMWIIALFRTSPSVGKVIIRSSLSKAFAKAEVLRLNRTIGIRPDAADTRDEDPREKGDDDGVEYGDPRDAEFE